MITLDSLFMLSVGQAPLDLQSFDCGRETVTNFFRNEAQAYQDELFGKTYFYVHPDNPTDVIAGFTVANASIFTKHLGNSRQKKDRLRSPSPKGTNQLSCNPTGSAWSRQQIQRKSSRRANH